MRRILLAAVLLSTVVYAPARAIEGAFAFSQGHEPSMSDTEIEQLREAAYIPNDRLAVFIKILDARTKAIQDLISKPHRPGREEDLHDLFTQFTSIIDELSDNLDDYGPRHRDLRKQLPKLLQATDRWATVLRSPSERDIDTVSRALALEGLKDVHDDTTKLIDEQRAYFTTHPEAAKQERERVEGNADRSMPGSSK